MRSNPRIPFAMPRSDGPPAHFRGKRVVVNVVINVEHWPFDKPMPRALMTSPHGKPAESPDIPNFSWVEYGLRRGMPRLLSLLGDHNIHASATMNSSVCDVYPELAERIGDAGWDIVGHGVTQESLKVVEDEEATIQESISRLTAYYGVPIKGWLGPGIAQTADTADYLKACGLSFTQDWMVDDQPCWMDTKHGPLLALPYSLEINDVPIWAINAFNSDELCQRVRSTLPILLRESEHTTQVMTIALHPHLIGVPHRFIHFEKLIHELVGDSDVAFAGSNEIAEWYIEERPVG